MSITIPSSFLPPSSPQGPAVNQTLPHGTSVGEGGDAPSETNLLMAAAEMHRMGRMDGLSPQQQKDFVQYIKTYKGISRMANPKAFSKAIEDMPLSTNIEDRRDESPKGKPRL